MWHIFPFNIVYFDHPFWPCVFFYFAVKEHPELGSQFVERVQKAIKYVGSLVNYSLAAPLRIVGKERHSISLGDYWRPKVILKVLRWSKGSFNPSNGSSCGRRNFDGTEHSRTAMVKGESLLLTILSKLQSVFSLIAFLNSSISFLISLRRSDLTPFGVLGRFFWLFLSSSQLVSERLSSYCSCSLISWFCLVSFSTVAASV